MRTEKPETTPEKNVKHTEGPWQIFWSYGGRECHRIYKGHSADISEMICDVNEFAPTDGDMEAEAKANARLITCAPELLACLEGFVLPWKGKALQHVPIEIREAMQLIALATKGPSK